MHPLFLIPGILGLWIGAELFVTSAKSIARSVGISEIFIGLTIASIGTSIPEMAVSIRGALDRIAGVETSNIVIGNAIGSVLNQLTILLGIVGLFANLYITKRELKRDGIMILLSLGALLLFGFNGQLHQIEGFVMVLFYLAYIAILIQSEKVKIDMVAKKEKLKITNLMKNSTLIVLGLFLVTYCGGLTVKSAISLSKLWKIPETFVGLVIVGLGTGLPELTISLIAALRGSTGIAIGNMIGSNITDLLFSVGLATLISGFKISQNLLYFDIPITIFLTSVVLVMLGTKYRLEKGEARILIAMYCVYLTIKILMIHT